MPRKARAPKEPDMDKDLQQVFTDMLKGPDERRAAFDRLKKMEAGSNVVYLPTAGTKKARVTKAAPAEPIVTEDNVKKVLKLYRAYEPEIKSILAIGGHIATALMSILLNRRPSPQLPPPSGSAE